MKFGIFHELSVAKPWHYLQEDKPDFIVAKIVEFINR